MRSVRHRSFGFTSAELLLAMALGAAVIGAAAIAFGTIARNQPHVQSLVNVTLDATRLGNYYGQSVSTWQTSTAPNYGAAMKAEDMRERFLADVMKAVAVFPLARTGVNTYRPAEIAFNPLVDTFPENPLKFREMLVNSGVASTLYQAKRNYDSTSPNCSIFVLGYSADATKLRVDAIYDIDIDKINSPKGFYASVKRYYTPVAGTAGLTAYYDVFYPPYDGTLWPTTSDKFTPLWVSFERKSRANMTPPESNDIERFKMAYEKPFHLIWWPDPSAATLGLYRATTSTFPATDPRQVYNPMAGRTSLMFTVPEFPSF